MSDTTQNGSDGLDHAPATSGITKRAHEGPSMGKVPDYRPASGVGMNGNGANGRGVGEAPLIVVQPLQKHEMQPSYASNLGLSGIDHGVYGTFINALGVCIGTLGAIPCCPCPNPYKRVEQGSVGLISRFGQFYRSVDPGLQSVNVCSESIRKVDVKIQLSAVPRQNVMTKDNVSVEIDSVICWHVVSPYRAAFGINDVRTALIERAQTTLRQVVGSRVLQTVVTDREGLAAEIQEIIEATATKWGITVESILLKDITFSVELQQSLSSAATQKRIGESRVIAARAEVDAAKLMRQAADILASPAAMQIRQLDTLRDMARASGSKVIFVPMNLQTTGSSAIQQQIASSMTPDGGEGNELEFTGGGGAYVPYVQNGQGQASGSGNDGSIGGGMVGQAGMINQLANM